MKKYLGEEFLNRIFKDLVDSEEVKCGGNKNEDVRLYMERLNKVLSHDSLRMLKEMY